MGFFSQMKSTFGSSKEKEKERSVPDGKSKSAMATSSRGEGKQEAPRSVTLPPVNEAQSKPSGSGAGEGASNRLSSGGARQTLNRDGFILVVSVTCPSEMSSSQRWQKEDFEVVKAIGSGRNSMVYLAKCKHTGFKIALKVYPKAVMSAVHKQQVMREITIHSKLQHRHIIGLYAAWEDEKAYYLVQEYASGGDLFMDLENSGGKMSESRAVREVVAPYLEVLSYLHGKGLIHRDIKPENSLFAEGHDLKVADFGLSIDTRLENPVTRLGTLDYMAPEVLVCPDKSSSKTAQVVQRRYDGMVDAWAMGVLSFELLTGRAPFEGESRDKTCAKIMTGNLRLPASISDLAADFIIRALHKHAIKRLSVTDMMAHPWIVKHTGGIQPHPGHNIRERQLETNHSMPAWALNKLIDDAQSPVKADKDSNRQYVSTERMVGGSNMPSGSGQPVNKHLGAAGRDLGTVKSLDRSTRETMHQIVKEESTRPSKLSGMKPGSSEKMKPSSQPGSREKM